MIQEFMTINRIRTYFNDSSWPAAWGGGMRDYHGLLQTFFLLAESFIYLNTAYDTFDTSDTLEMKQVAMLPH